MRFQHRHPLIFRIFWIIVVILVVATAFSIAFYITHFIYSLFHITLPILAAQQINFFLGLIITGATIRLFGRFFRRQQLDAFEPIIDAMERIARGDFSIRVENDFDDGLLHGLVTSVNKMAQELGQMENMRQEFIANISHEIQSPLTSIRGFAQALQNNQLSPMEHHHYLEIIEAESNRLSRLTDDLLKLAALDAEQAKFEPQRYQLDQQIRSVILTCEPQWRDKQLEMDVELDGIEIQADADLLSQVWMNLLHNAIKFTSTGGRIAIALHPHGEQVEFSIADSGIGISADERVHIFERFYKADKSRTRAAGGSGLGLAIVKKIIDLHHGAIDLTSEVGQGTTFTVELPLEQP
jgi:two-component system, OmpR family, phosphate regulon sensor histidine kinase PhoR